MHVVGPVFYYDVVRSARRGRIFSVRALFVLLLLLGLTLLLLALAPQLEWAMAGGQLSPGALAEIAEAFFGTFLVLQFVLVVLITPALVASAITEEKQRQTLDFLFTTDLRNREIILGKFGSRLGSGVMLLAAGYPVLALVQLFGGVDPLLLMAGYAVTFATQVSVACIGLYFSVRARRVREALLKTYLALFAYLAGWGVLTIFRGLIMLDAPPGAPPLQTMDQIMDWYNIGNPFVLLVAIVRFVQIGGGAAWDALVDLAAWYFAFHLTIALFFLWRAIRIVRRVYIRQTYDPKPKKRLKGWMALPVGALVKKALRPTRPLNADPKKSARRKPPVGADPMLWKEFYVEKGLRYGALAYTGYVMLMFFLLSVGLVLAGVLIVNVLMGTTTSEISEPFNVYFRLLAALLMLMTLVSVGLRAASSIGAEKDRQTWDALLASPLHIRQIVVAKGLGAMRGARLYPGILLVFALFGVIGQALSIAGVILEVVAVLAVTFFAAGLGLWCAARAKTATRASAGVLFLLILVNLMPLLLQFALAMINSLTGGALMAGNPLAGYRAPEWYSSLDYFAPLLLVYQAAMHPEQEFLGRALWDPVNLEGGATIIRGAILALALVYYAGGGTALWRLAARRLWQTCGRVDAHRVPHNMQLTVAAGLPPAAGLPGSTDRTNPGTARS